MACPHSLCSGQRRRVWRRRRVPRGVASWPHLCAFPPQKRLAALGLCPGMLLKVVVHLLVGGSHALKPCDEAQPTQKRSLTTAMRVHLSKTNELHRNEGCKTNQLTNHTETKAHTAEPNGAPELTELSGHGQLRASSGGGAWRHNERAPRQGGGCTVERQGRGRSQRTFVEKGDRHGERMGPVEPRRV